MKINVMKKSPLRSAMLYAGMFGGFILLDIIIDYLFGGVTGLNLAHVIFAIVVVLSSFIFLRWALNSLERAEAVLRQSRDELERQVQERTAELEQMNTVLKKEITERQHMEEEIVRLSTFPQLNPNPILEVNLAGEVIYCNSATLDTLTRLGLDDPDAFIPADINFSQEIELGQTKQAVREVNVNGSIFGATIHFVRELKSARIYANNITEIKEMEAALLVQTNQLHERVKELNCLYGIATLSGRKDMLLGEILQGVVDLIPSAWQWSDYACAQIVLDQQIFQTSNYQETTWKQTSPIFVQGNRAGTVTVCYLDKKPFIDEGPFLAEERNLLNGIAEQIGQITERYRAEKALAESERKLDRMLQTMLDGTVMVDLTGQIVYANRSAERILELRKDEIVGRYYNSREFQQLDEHGQPFPLDQLPLAIALREHRDVYQLEHQIVNSDGEMISLLVNAAPLINEEGQPYGAVASFQDITKRKQSEEALRQAQGELARGLKERVALEERQRLARELHDSVSQALYGISLGAHTAITLFEKDPIRVHEALGFILSQAQVGLNEMRALIFELRPESLEMEGLVSALTKQATALQARHEIRIELDLCDEPDIPLSDKEVIYRIAQEALHNAIKHAQSNQLNIYLFCESGYLSLEVCDNGVGFDPLANYPGHIGLQSMHERAMNIGGTLEIDSTPAYGTKVRVRIPFPNTNHNG